MEQLLAYASETLQAHGLLVSRTGADSLLVYLTTRPFGNDNIVIEDATSLDAHGNGLIVRFPTSGMYAYELEGTVEELVKVILAVYGLRKKTGDGLPTCFEKCVDNLEQYLRQ